MVSITIYELIALHCMLGLGKMFTRPDERKKVEALLSRIGKKLETIGMDRDLIDKLVKL